MIVTFACVIFVEGPHLQFILDFLFLLALSMVLLCLIFSLQMCREWNDFKYPPRSIRFGYGLGSSESSEAKGGGAINLPQFSSATVPKVQAV